MISIGSKHLTIAKFWYDEKFYDIALTRDLKFRYSYFDKDNNLHLNLSLRDYSIIYFVLTSLKVDGGASANNLLMQIQADLLNTKVNKLTYKYSNIKSLQVSFFLKSVFKKAKRNVPKFSGLGFFFSKI